MLENEAGDHCFSYVGALCSGLTAAGPVPAWPARTAAACRSSLAQQEIDYRIDFGSDS